MSRNAATELTKHPTSVTPDYDLAPWTVELLVDGYDSRWPGGPYEMPDRCEACGARGEELLFRGHHGDWQCGSCAAACEYCDERPAVVSARRPKSDPTAPGQIDHVCEACLRKHWDPAETVLGAWICEACDQYHVGPASCCICEGSGLIDGGEGGYCHCATGRGMFEAERSQHAWMQGHVRDAVEAERAGDFEHAREIRRSMGVAS